MLSNRPVLRIHCDLIEYYLRKTLLRVLEKVRVSCFVNNGIVERRLPIKCDFVFVDLYEIFEGVFKCFLFYLTRLALRPAI